MRRRLIQPFATGKGRILPNPGESFSKACNLKGSLTQFCPEDKEEEDDTPSNQTKPNQILPHLVLTCSSLSHVIKTWLNHHDQGISLKMNHFHSFRSQV